MVTVDRGYGYTGVPGSGTALSHLRGNNPSAPAVAAAGLLASSSSILAARRLRYVVPSGNRTYAEAEGCLRAEAQLAGIDSSLRRTLIRC